METKEGIIQRIKDNRKALAIENVWFNSFKPLDESIKVGDSVKLIYSIKGDFRNIRSIEQIKNEAKKLIEPINKTETKIDYKVTENKESKEKIASMILSYCKDLAVSYLENGKEPDYKEITNKLLESYKLIIATI